nr:hypothetical protein PJ912_18580 [Pectobacterium colocasium]
MKVQAPRWLIVPKNRGDSTLHGGASWGTGPDGSSVALVLDGVDGYVSLPGKVMENLGDFTVVTRFCADDKRTWARIFDMGWAPAAGSPYYRIVIRVNPRSEYPVYMAT